MRILFILLLFSFAAHGQAELILASQAQAGGGGQTCTCSGTNTYSTTACAGRCGDPNSTGAHSAGYILQAGTFDTGDSGNYDSTNQAYEGTTSLMVRNISGTPATSHGIRTNNHTITGSGGNSTARFTFRYYSVSGIVRVQMLQAGRTAQPGAEDVINISSPTRNTWIEVSYDFTPDASNDWGWRFTYLTDGEMYFDCINLEMIP